MNNLCDNFQLGSDVQPLSPVLHRHYGNVSEANFFRIVVLVFLAITALTGEVFSQTCGQGGTRIAVGGTALAYSQVACPNEIITYGYTGTTPLSSPSWSIIPSNAGTFANGNSTGSSVTVTWISSGTLRLDYPNASGSQCDEVMYSITNYDAGTVAGPATSCYGGNFELTLSNSQNAGGAVWQKCTGGCGTESNWVTLGSVSGSALQVSNFTVTTSFRTKLSYANCGGGTDYSNVKEVAVNSTGPLNVVINDPSAICAAQATTLVFQLNEGSSTVGTNPTFEWFRNGGNNNEPGGPGDSNSDPKIYDPIDPGYTFQQGETVQLKVTSGPNCVAWSNIVTINFNTENFPSLGSITSTGVCAGKQATFNCDNQSGSWQIGSGGFPYTGVNYTIPADEADGEIVYFTTTLTGSCGTSQQFSTHTSTVTAMPLPDAVAISDEICTGETSSVSVSSSMPGTTFSWAVTYENASGSLTSGNGSPINQVVTVTSVLSGKAVYTITPESPAGCVGDPVIAEVIVHHLPVNPSLTSLQYCDFQVLTLKGTPSTTISGYKWYNNQDLLLGQGLEYPVGVERTGTYDFKFEAVDQNGCLSGIKSPITVNIISPCEDLMNSIETIQYELKNGLDNGTGDVETAHSKEYFDLTGRPIQTQAKNLTEDQIFSSTSVKDQSGRIALSTLSALTGNTAFLYKHWFLTDVQGNLYDHDRIGNALSQEPGTVGWYYSASNANEQNVPQSSIPYARTEYYGDGSGEVKKAAGPGEAMQMGSGNEVLSGTFPVYNELAHYLTLRGEAIQGINQDGSFFEKGVQSVVRDQNENYTINISDKSGSVVMSARKGIGFDENLSDHVIHVENTVESTLESRPLTYFYILEDQPVTITSSQGSSYHIEDIVAGTTYTPPVSGIWNAGFYRIVLSSGSTTLHYSNYFLDVSYQFYDDAGRLRSSLSPNGFKQLKDDSNLTYTEADQTTYHYNHQGWLLSMIEPDAGETKYVYRKDGKIRFSQNAEQFKNGRFSYTHYDQIGRPVESGEYTGAMAFTAMSEPSFASSDMFTQLEYAGQINWNEMQKMDWVRTVYDFSDVPQNENIPNLDNAFRQQFVRGAVSSSENRNNKTWYSYDEFGRVVWMAQKPKALPATFVTSYEYDFSGNVKTVKSAAYKNGGEFNVFYHHYEFDADLRLSSASTSTDGANKKLRATYEYYLHGPLKRIELGEKLQGIDYVYNIQGWLTQINHPDHAEDPGNDGIGDSDVKSDVFGMVLDYYESTVSGLYSVSKLDPNHHPNLFHGLPSISNGDYYAMHQGMTKPAIPHDRDFDVNAKNSFRSYSAGNAQNIQTISRDTSSQR